jgi:hypothetical protein
MSQKITISKPNPYLSSEINIETGVKTPMISFVVTGAGAKQYALDELAKGYDSKDDLGNPLIHFTAKAGGKYGEVAVLERAVLETGEPIWFDPTQQEEKQIGFLMAGMDETTKNLYAQERLAKVRSMAKALVANRQANIAVLKAKASSEKIDDLGNP